MKATDMNEIHDSARDRDNRLDDFAAELTSAVYPMVLRHGLGGSWLRVELGLWRALAETVEEWVPHRPAAGLSEEFESWRAGLLADLTDSALCVAVNNEVHPFQTEVWSGLYQALAQAIRRHSHGN
jgi:hypothetical protein